MSSTTGNMRLPALSLELFLLSFTSLFFELLIVRWLGCDFKTFMVFKNFPLVTCFVGLGVGVSMSNDKMFKYAPATLLFSVFCIFVSSFSGMRETAFPAAGVYQWLDIHQPQLPITVALITIAMITILAGPFAFMVCIGSRIGQLFNQHKPLHAYCIDIFGAICGSCVFALTSFFCLNPGWQLGVAGTLLMIYARKHAGPVWKSGSLVVASVVAAVLTVGVAGPKGVDCIWSPYYRLAVAQAPISANVLPEGTQYRTPLYISVNHSFMQAFMDNSMRFKPDARKDVYYKTLEDAAVTRSNYYSLPYMLNTPHDVLILGAGVGSDVDEALKHGAKSIDAVEIDPQVIALGKQYNPAYSTDKVRVHCDDARSYINSCKKKYDLVIFGCLDSLGQVGVSSMRTDSYIHTEDSYKQCLTLLKPGGLFILSFGAASDNNSGDWLRDKIYATLKNATGYAPIVMSDVKSEIKWPAYVFIAGQPVANGALHAPITRGTYTTEDMPAVVQARTMTDDWPYLYVKPIGVDVPYMFVLLVVIAIAVFAGRHLVFNKEKTGSDGQLFFLGAAFMLIELQAISRLSLLYGNTWFTVSIVVNGILVMILAANFLVLKFGKAMPQPALYAALLMSLGVSWALPVQQILGMPSGPAIVTALTLLPMFMAGLIFARAFALVSEPSKSFAYNLLGSVAGGLLEYVSTYLGINSLVLFAAALYCCSFACYAAGTRMPSMKAASQSSSA